MLEYNRRPTIQIHIALKVACESEALLGSEPCEKWDLRDASEGADCRSFHTDETAVEKARGAKYEMTAGSENRNKKASIR